MTEKTIPQKGKEQDGFVVWDKRGLVVAWPDQHRSRFSWEELRHLCLCAECREQHSTQETQTLLANLDSARAGRVATDATPELLDFLGKQGIPGSGVPIMLANKYYSPTY